MTTLEILEINLLFQDKLINHFFQVNEFQPINHLFQDKYSGRTKIRLKNSATNETTCWPITIALYISNF